MIYCRLNSADVVVWWCRKIWGAASHATPQPFQMGGQACQSFLAHFCCHLLTIFKTSLPIFETKLRFPSLELSHTRQICCEPCDNFLSIFSRPDAYLPANKGFVSDFGPSVMHHPKHLHYPEKECKNATWSERTSKKLIKLPHGTPNKKRAETEEFTNWQEKIIFFKNG